MNFSSFAAMRFMASNRESRYYSWIGSLTIFGVAIGVAAMIVVWSVIDGFEVQLRERFLAANAHVIAFRYPAGLPNHRTMAKRVEKDFGTEVKGISPFVHGESMIRRQSILHSVLVRGVSPKERNAVQDISNIIAPLSAWELLNGNQKTQNNLPPIIVGHGLLDKLGAKIGDRVEIVAPAAKSGSNYLAYEVVGTYNSGLQHYDNKLALMGIPAAQRLLNMKKRVTGLEIGLHDPDESKPVARRMLAKYNLSIKEWQSFNRNIFAALEQEKMMIMVIVAFIVFVATFNIFTTIFVTVYQKQKDISVMKALGATDRQIIAVFMKLGLIFGSVGSVIGVLFAVGLGYAIEKYQYMFIKIPDVYFLASLPVSYDLTLYVGVVLSVMLICVLMSFLPAYLGARVNPAEGMSGQREIV